MAESSDKHDAICISGMGLATCLGLDVETNWKRVRRGECGIGPMPALESPLPAGKDGGQAPDLPADFWPALPREARYLRWTIDAAMKDAHLPPAPACGGGPGRGTSERRDASGDASETTIDRPTPQPPPASGRGSRISLLLGTTLHGMRAGGTFLRSNDYADLDTFLAGDTIALATRGLPIDGMRATTCSACSSSLGAIAMGVTLLETNQADTVIAGGYDTISEYVYAGFNALRLISDPPLRPFTKGRVGMKVAEGYGIVVLQRVQDARRPIALLSGWGESADAFHLTRPHPEGSGALAAMRQSIGRAGISPADIDLVAAHATGTPDNDLSESAALLKLFGPHAPAVVGFKSHLGHTLGGAGAAELILSACALRDQVAPPTANIELATTEYPLALTHRAERPLAITHTLNTSLGFGGANTCVVLSSATQSPPPCPLPQYRERETCVITGIGVLLPDAIGNDALAAMLREQRSTTKRTIDDAEFESLINARRIRRMSPYVKYSLCAATIACRNAGLLDSPELKSAGAILGTTHGSAGYSYDYYTQIVREGIAAANPMLFAEGVPNAAAAQLSLMLGLTGACQTIIGTRTAGLDALRLAALRVASGTCDRLIVCAAEEPHFTLDHAYERCATDERPTPSCAGAIALVVESEAAAKARGATIYAAIDNTASASSLKALVRDGGIAIEAVNTVPVVFGGQLFSVEPLLALTAGLLLSDKDALTVAATDRTGPATAIALKLKRAATSQPRSLESSR